MGEGVATNQCGSVMARGTQMAMGEGVIGRFDDGDIKQTTIDRMSKYGACKGRKFAKEGHRQREREREREGV